MHRLAAALLMSLPALAGCTQERVAGDAATYTYATWVFLLSAVGAAVLAGWGFAIVRQESKFAQRSIGIGMLLGGLLLLLGFAPRVFFTYVTVDDAHVEGDDRALWFLADPNKQFNIAFADVVGLEEQIVQQIGRKNRDKEIRYLVFRHRSGVDKTVLLTSLLAAARPRIEAAIEKQAAAGSPAVAVVAPPPRDTPPNPPTPPRVSAERPRPTPPPGVRAPADQASTRPAPTAQPTETATAAQPRPSAGRRPGGAFDIPPDREITADTPLAVGDTVEGYRGEWLTAEVTELLPGGMVKVKFANGRPPFPVPQPRSRLRLPE
ncbi:MAG: hypothetical protein RLZZ440_1689 [Planctomycetota bacterium]